MARTKKTDDVTPLESPTSETAPAEVQLVTQTQAAAPASPPEQPQTPERVPVETLLAPLPAWQQAALRVAGNWPRGQQITREEFEQLRKNTLEGVIR